MCDLDGLLAYVIMQPLKWRIFKLRTFVVILSQFFSVAYHDAKKIEKTMIALR